MKFESRPLTPDCIYFHRYITPQVYEILIAQTYIAKETSSCYTNVLTASIIQVLPPQVCKFLLERGQSGSHWKVQVKNPPYHTKH